MDLGLTERPALVAAGTQGLGLACAMALAREGARVAVCSRRQDAVEAACRRIREETGVDAIGIQADVSKDDDAIRFVEEAAGALGGCHILVANAGGPPPGTAVSMGDKDFREALDLNFFSVVRMVRSALPHMRRAGYGRVISISSSSVKEPIPNLALSNAARAATTGFLKTIAREVAADGITVNAVLPGRFLTDRARQLAASQGRSVEDVLHEQAADVPIGRHGEPGELGDVVAFLASERAAYVTGCMLSVDGGLLRSLF